MIRFSTTGIQLDRISYGFLGRTIMVSSNSAQWLKGLDGFLCLKKRPESSAPSVELTVLSVPGSELDEAVPLPGPEFLKREGPSFLGTDSRYRLFVRDSEFWNDWGGYGRIRTNRISGKAVAAMIAESRWDPFYGIILFGYNALMGLLYRSGLFSVHASCVCVGGKGILFTGESGSGKSTAALAVARRGHPVVSDDRLVIYRDTSYNAANISDVFKIREDALHHLFPSLKNVKPYRVAMDECYYKISLLPEMNHLAKAPVLALFVLEKTGERDSEIARIHPAMVVKDLFPVTLNPYDPEQAQEKFQFLIGMLKEIPCYRARFGTDMDSFASRVEEAAGVL